MHPSSAAISTKAKIGSNVTIGPYTLVKDNVVIEDNTVIGSHCILGEETAAGSCGPLIVRANSLIRSHSIFYQGSEFGPHLMTGHGVTVREGIYADEGLKLGTRCDLMGSQKFGKYVRLHSNVFVGPNARIDDFVWVFPGTVITDDPHPPSHTSLGVHLQAYSVVAAACCILPGVTVGSHALVAASSLVKDDVRPGWVVAGRPAQHKFEARHIKLKSDPQSPAYPWTKHFDRGYPEHIVSEWLAEAHQQMGA